MNLLCLCPTYGHERLLPNALACFLAQDYPAQHRRLLIYDDAAQFLTSAGDGWRLVSTGQRMPSLPTKYEVMVGMEDSWADAFVVWDDDDVYLPWHLSAIAETMHAIGRDGWAKPNLVLSTYTGQPALEDASGRFHGSIAIGRNLYDKVGGWRGVMPPGQERLADFDQRMIAALSRLATPARPDDLKPQSYVYRWGSTGAHHCSAAMKSPSDETWYNAAPSPTKYPSPLELTPKFDDETRWLYEILSKHGTGFPQAANNQQSP